MNYRDWKAKADLRETKTEGIGEKVWRRLYIEGRARLLMPRAGLRSSIGTRCRPGEGQSQARVGAPLARSGAASMRSARASHTNFTAGGGAAPPPQKQTLFCSTPDRHPREGGQYLRASAPLVCATEAEALRTTDGKSRPTSCCPNSVAIYSRAAPASALWVGRTEGKQAAP